MYKGLQLQFMLVYQEGTLGHSGVPMSSACQFWVDETLHEGGRFSMNWLSPETVRTCSNPSSIKFNENCDLSSASLKLFGPH